MRSLETSRLTPVGEIMSDRQIKVTVEHEPGCMLVVIIGILLGMMLTGKLGGCVINIGTEVNQNIPRTCAGKQ